MTFEEKELIVGLLTVFICGVGGLLIVSKILNAVKRARGVE